MYLYYNARNAKYYMTVYNIACYLITDKMFRLSRQDSSTQITNMLNTSNILISYSFIRH